MAELNKKYAVLPLRNTVLFPNQIIPIYIGRKQSLQLISDVNELEDKTIVVVAQKDGNKENPEPQDLYENAVIGKVMKVFDMPEYLFVPLCSNVNCYLSSFLKDSFRISLKIICRR